ncbi:TetR/AcrR family transcriptional regulator [Aurantivibrio infirmus]
MSANPQATSQKELRRTQAERKQEAERRIIESAISIMAEKGLSGLTLAAAGEGAGYSRGIAGHHFGKKDELLIATVRYITGKFSEELIKRMHDRPGLAMLQEVIREYFVRANKDARAIKALHILLSEGVCNPVLRAPLAEVNAAGIKGIAYHIRCGIDQGEIRKDIDAKAQALIIISSLRGIMAQWLVDNQRISLAAVQKEFLASVIRSLAP